MSCAYASAIADRASGNLDFGFDDCVVGLANAIPALVAVHRVVSPNHGGDRGPMTEARLQPHQTIDRRFRRRVASIREDVHDDGTPLPVRIPASAATWSSCECTPPGRNQAERDGTCRRSVSASVIRARSASVDLMLPDAIASLIRGRSCITTRPAPMLKCPTSELPICPSGRPTSRPDVPGVRADLWPRDDRNSVCEPAERHCRPGLRASPSHPKWPASPDDVLAWAHLPLLRRVVVSDHFVIVNLRRWGHRRGIGNGTARWKLPYESAAAGHLRARPANTVSAAPTAPLPSQASPASA